MCRADFLAKSAKGYISADRAFLRRLNVFPPISKKTLDTATSLVSSWEDFYSGAEFHRHQMMTTMAGGANAVRTT
jgi:hypothetical protein